MLRLQWDDLRVHFCMSINLQLYILTCTRVYIMITTIVPIWCGIGPSRIGRAIIAYPSYPVSTATF